MKRIVVCVICLTLAWVCLNATEPQEKFSPEKFQAELEQFITREASLTSVESARFFPLYREMQQKQRAVYKQMRELGRNKPADEASCKQAVQKRDALELEQKRIQQTYHDKFFRVLPASKVYDVIRAEDRFHRYAFKNWSNHPRHSQKK